MNYFAICLIFPVLFMLIGCAPSARSQTERDDAIRLQDISPESLLVISKTAEQTFQKYNLLFTDKVLEQYLDEVLERLVSLREKEQYNLKTKILRRNNINAFAYPHGTIFITVSLLVKLENEAQLAAVLSHELIHIVNGHAQKNLIRLKERSKTETRLHSDLAALFAAEGVSAGSSAAAALNAAMRGYSREFEREADSLGALRMAKGGYPHEEYLNLLLLLQDYVKSEEITEQTVFGSHPRITERIRNYYRIVGDNISGGSLEYKNGGVFKERIKKAAYDNVRVNVLAERYDLAETQIEKFLADDSCDTDALILYGDFEKSLSPRSTEFFIWYERALECDPSNAAALRAIGFAYYSLGEYQKAYEFLSRYCEIAETAADIGTARLMLRKCEEYIIEK